MHISRAVESDLETVKNITYETIKTVYPRYYPAGVVDFFITHHSTENIMADIVSGNIFLAMIENKAVGTITIKNIEICRFFVLPQYQGKGYGKALMEYAEGEIFLRSEIIKLDSSLPAKRIYIKNGYKVFKYHTMPINNGDYLCYDVMEKSLGSESC